MNYDLNYLLHKVSGQYLIVFEDEGEGEMSIYVDCSAGDLLHYVHVLQPTAHRFIRYAKAAVADPEGHHLTAVLNLLEER